MRKICIFGAGAVGGHMAARLALAGLQVSVVVRGAHLDAIRRDGLRLIAPDGDFTVPVAASDDPRDLGHQDLVISTVKANTLSEIAPGFKPLLHTGTPVVFAVNGIPWWYFHGRLPDASEKLKRLDRTGQLWKDVGPERALGCVVRSPNQIVAPGVIRSNAPSNSYLVGEPDGTHSARLKEIVATMRLGMPDTNASADIRAEIWQKLMLNIPSSLTASLTLSTGTEIFANPEMREIYRAIGEEAQSVANACGAPAKFDLPAQIASSGPRRHPPSMLQDLVAGRALEIDAQIMAVQDLARQANVKTPIMDVAAALLFQRAQSQFAQTLKDTGKSAA